MDRRNEESRACEQRALLIITTSYPISADGSEAAGSFVADMVRGVAGHIPVRVVAPGLREQVEECSGTLVWRFAAGATPLSLLRLSNPAHWPHIVATLLSLKRQTLAAAGDGHVAHSLALWALPSGWAAQALTRSSAVPYSIWALGSDFWSLGRIPIVNRVLRSVCHDAANRFADGLELASYAETLSGAPFDLLPSCRCMPAGRSSPVADVPPYRLLFLGRWHQNKGIDLLLDALSMLSERDWELIREVHIAGGGPMEALVRERTEGLRSQGRPVRLSGYLDRQEAARALDNADRLLLPSRIESIPVIFSDALALELPIVAMPVGDLPRLLQNGGGWLASAVSATAFSSVLRKCLTGGRPPQMALGLREEFRPEVIARRIASLVAPP